MDGQAGISTLDRDRMAGMNAHPDPDGRVGRPLMAGQRPLDLQRAQDRLLRARERHEERVTLGVNFVTGLPGNGRPDQAPVIGQNLDVLLPQRLDQPGRTFDIGEQEGNRAAREVSHGTGSIPCGHGPSA